MPLRETSDRQVNDLLSDFSPKGGNLTQLPNIKEVRDQSLHILTQKDATYLMMAVNGKWEMITNFKPTWEDLRFPASLGKLPAVSYPTWTDCRGGQILAFSTGEIVFFLAQLPHTWIEGDSIEPHLHLIPHVGTPSNMVAFNLTYSIANIGEAFPAETTITAEHTFANESQYDHINLDFDPITMKGKKIASMIIISLERVAPSGVDYASDIGLLELDFHFRRSPFGSEREMEKVNIKSSLT